MALGSPLVPARDDGAQLFRDLGPDDQLTRLGRRAFDVLMALIEASLAVISKDDSFEPRLARRDRRREPVAGCKIAALRKGFSGARSPPKTAPFGQACPPPGPAASRR
jgi:hypothetical protein